MAEAHAAPHRGASVPVEIGASSVTPFLTCLDSPRRASDSLSSPQAGGAGRANGARLDGVARAWPARQEQANNFRLPRLVHCRGYERNAIANRQSALAVK